MAYFKFLSPMYDDRTSHKPIIKQIPTIFLKLDNLFKGYSDQKPNYCPVFEFKEGIWVEKKKTPDVTPDNSWEQSSFLIYIPEGPYYASLRNFTGNHKKIRDAELVVQTHIEEEYIDFMRYEFKNAIVQGVTINHELEHLELILGCDSLILEIKNIDPITKNVLGKSVSEVDMVRHKVC